MLGFQQAGGNGRQTIGTALRDGDVGARVPDLGGGLAVPSPSKDVVARGDLGGHLQAVLDGIAAAPHRVRYGCTVVHLFRQFRVVLGTRRGAGSVGGIPRRPAPFAREVAMLAAWHHVVARRRARVRQRVNHPADAAAFCDERGVDLVVERAVAIPHHVVQWVRKLERHLLEALFRERLVRWAQSILVAATVGCGEFPPRVLHRAPGPHGAGGSSGKHLRPQIALLRELGCVVRPGVECLGGGAAGHPARVKDRSCPRGPPRVEFPNVGDGAPVGLDVRGAVLGEDLALDGTSSFVRAVIKVGESGPISITLGAAGGAALGEPETRLARVALRFAPVCAAARVWLN
mmetsp:Transcript_20068/g.52122  ORF Transcript_20068/g.52122 Transcript_20068/m.52122 type:complete len:346 (-) Transcript_20068:206-1243(-)